MDRVFVVIGIIIIFIMLMVMARFISKAMREDRRRAAKVRQRLDQVGKYEYGDQIVARSHRELESIRTAPDGISSPSRDPKTGRFVKSTHR